MVQAALLYLLKPKYNGYKVYAHNLSGFDVNFLMPTLSLLNSEGKAKVSVIKKDNQIINISLIVKPVKT